MPERVLMHVSRMGSVTMVRMPYLKKSNDGRMYQSKKKMAVCRGDDAMMVY